MRISCVCDAFGGSGQRDSQPPVLRCHSGTRKESQACTGPVTSRAASRVTQAWPPAPPAPGNREGDQPLTKIITKTYVIIMIYFLVTAKKIRTELSCIYTAEYLLNGLGHRWG